MATLSKTGIPYLERVWNPVTGCHHGCVYCYARREAEGRLRHVYQDGGYLLYTSAADRFAIDAFGGDMGPFWPRFWPERLAQVTPGQVPRRVGVCFQGDLFGEWVPLSAIQQVLEAECRADQHTFVHLTKNPRRYLEIPVEWWPSNCWLGATADTGIRMRRWLDIVAQIKTRTARPRQLYWVSVEPIQQRIVEQFNPWLLEQIDWLVIGGQTGPEPKPDPVDVGLWAKQLASVAHAAKVPVYEKDNIPNIIVQRREMPYAGRPSRPVVESRR